MWRHYYDCTGENTCSEPLSLVFFMPRSPFSRVMSSTAEEESRPKGRKVVVWKCARELRWGRILCFQSIKVALHTLHHLRFFTSILHEIKNFSYLHGIGGHLGCELFWIKLWGRGGESLPKNKAVMFPSQAKSFLFCVWSFAWRGDGGGPMVELMVCCKCRGLDPGLERRSTHLGWT